MNTKKVKLSDIKFGPIRQEVLPDGFIERVKDYKDILREVETTSLEKTISNFQRDHHPERELEVWENIATCYKESCKNNPNWTAKERKEAFKVLLIASMGY